jgi:hypothetical protein
VRATFSFIEGHATISKDHFSDFFGLAAAESVLGVPLLGVSSGPRLATVMTVGAAKHIVVVGAARTIGKFGRSSVVRLASVHLLRRSGSCRIISRPAQATVIAPIAEAIFIIGMLSSRVGVALRSALVGKAPTDNFSRVPFQGVFERI